MRTLDELRRTTRLAGAVERNTYEQWQESVRAIAETVGEEAETEAVALAVSWHETWMDTVKAKQAVTEQRVAALKAQRMEERERRRRVEAHKERERLLVEQGNIMAVRLKMAEDLGDGSADAAGRLEQARSNMERAVRLLTEEREWSL